MSQLGPQGQELVEPTGRQHRDEVDHGRPVGRVDVDGLPLDEGLPVGRGSAVCKVNLSKELEVNAVTVAGGSGNNRAWLLLFEASALDVGHLPDERKVLDVLPGLEAEGASAAAETGS